MAEGPTRLLAEIIIDGVGFDRYDLTTSAEPIEVRSMDGREFDPAWSITDAAGHFHAYSVEGKTPTLRAVHLGASYCPDCEDMHEDWEDQCVICGAPVIPGTRPASPVAYIPGLVTTTLRVRTRGVGGMIKGKRISVLVPARGFGIMTIVSVESCSDWGGSHDDIVAVGDIWPVAQ